MEQQQLDRINELARLAKQRGLTQEEARERQSLREAYIASYKQSLTAQLDNTFLVDENGNKRKLQKKQTDAADKG